MSHQDRKELALAIEAYGLKVIAGALDKSPDVKKTSCESIKKLLSDYESDEMKPGKMLKATTQITVRLIRDKMWVIFNMSGPTCVVGREPSCLAPMVSTTTS